MDEVKFEIKVSKKDLANFMIYHNYHSIQGVIGILISLVALVLLIINIRRLTLPEMLVLIVMILAFTVLTPVILMRKAAAQEKRNKTFEKPITYELRNDGFSLYQGEERADLEWRNVYKVADTGRCLVLYVSTIRGFIWPKDQLKGKETAVEDMLKSHLESRKTKFRLNK